MDQLTQKASFRDGANAGVTGGDVSKADVVADFVTEPDVAFGRDAARREAGHEAARLINTGLEAGGALLKGSSAVFNGFGRLAERRPLERISAKESR